MKFDRGIFKMLRDQIKVGDERLADHIAQQIAAVRDALLTADGLERERVNAIKEMALERVKSQEAALHEASITNDQRFKALEKAAATHLTIDEYDRRHETLENRLTNLESWRSNLMGRYVGLAVIGALFVAVVSGVIVHLAGG